MVLIARCSGALTGAILMSGFPEKTLLPAGMFDVLPPDAAFEARTVDRLMAFFAGYGYERVKPPLMEFEEGLLAGPGVALASQAFRLMDPVSQRMLALRPDMTMQVARIAADRLGNRPRPLRLGYVGQVVRVRGSQLRPARQFGQAGAELIGSAAPRADAEVILMASAALADLGIGALTVDLGIPSLVSELIAERSANIETRRRLQLALHRKDAAAVAATAAALGRETAALLAEMVTIAGPAEEALQALMRLDLPTAAARQRAALAEVVGGLRETEVPFDLSIDPAESRGFEYHCGVTFALFAEGIRGELGRGGRYVAGTVGGGEPATGVTLFMDSLLPAVARPEPRHRILLPAGTTAEAATRLRDGGWIAIDALEAVADLEAEAVRLGCTHILADAVPRLVEGN